MSLRIREGYVLGAILTLILAGCASYNPDYSSLQQQPLTTEAQLLPVDADIAELIRYAQNNHPSVLAAEAELAGAKAALTAAGAFADPELSVSQGLNDSDYFTLGLAQEIPLFNRRGMNIEQARTAMRAAEAGLLQVQAELAADVVAAFSEYLYVQENLALQGDLIQLLQQFTAVAEQSYAAGTVAMADLLRAQNTLDEARSEQENLQSMLFSQRARLNSALGRDAREPLPGDYSLAQTHAEFSELPAEANDLYGMIAAQNPAVAAVRYQVQSLLVNQDVANTAGLPRLMLGVEYMNTDMSSDTVAGMVSVSLPVWRSSYRAQREAAEAEVQSGYHRLQAVKLEVQAELSMAVYQWRESERNRQLYGDVLIARAEQAVATSLSNYQSGNASYTDVIVSQQEWLSFALAYQRALANQLAAVGIIQSLIVPATEFEVGDE